MYNRGGNGRPKNSMYRADTAELRRSGELLTVPVPPPDFSVKREKSGDGKLFWGAGQPDLKANPKCQPNSERKKRE